ncbi:MAG: hypothetical protein LUD81_10655 [Clostridiales bacterium]|nr:hypothetical protein [Clostridiales bacterium]
MKKYKIILYFLLFLNMLPVISLIPVLLYHFVNLKGLFVAGFMIFIALTVYKIYIFDTIALALFYLYAFIKRRITLSLLHIETAVLSLIICIGTDIFSNHMFWLFMSV